MGYRSVEIEDFVFLNRRVTFQMIINAIHLSYDSLWKIIDKEFLMLQASAH